MPYMRAIMSALAEGLPGARVAEVSGAGHLPHLTHPGVYADLLISHAASDPSLEPLRPEGPATA
ncbi:hypothetical protein GCM10023215_02990 [Pseudonocardia yuanmonensis]|uniref:Alpha/beta hydrolase family protein n=1 Tax=Pseudonocardia yuanmonensis TaxID=1095914 RepID=A0ABP8VZA9_9PSEU